jgi:hypothetical protein
VLLQTLQTCSVPGPPRGVFLEEALTACLLEQRQLAGQVVVRGRDTGIPYFHLALLFTGVVGLQKFSHNGRLLRQSFAPLRALP